MRSESLVATRRSLLSRLRRWDDQRSWEDFFSTYWRLIHGAALKAGLSEADAEDVVQEVVIAVAKKMPDFRYDPARGSFKGWLLQITRRRISDHLRRKYREPAAQLEDVEPALAPTAVEAFWEAEWDQHLLEAALSQVRARVDPEQFQIFDCYVLKGWPVADVVRALGVTRNQVYLAKSRISALLKRECARIGRGE